MRHPHVAVVAYDFPPHGAIGTLRTLRLVKCLDREGWRVTVITGAPRTYLPGTPVEEELVRSVPDPVHVCYAAARRPYLALKRVAGLTPPSGSAGRSRSRKTKRSTKSGLRAAVGALLEVPDRENGWIVPAVVCGLRQSRPDVLYSSAPPWSGQIVASVLSTVWRCPWVADFRDPWARAPWREGRHPLRKRAASRLERHVVKQADAVLFATQANQDDFASLYGKALADKFHVVPNGCDPALFSGVVPTPSDKFVLLHTGNLYAGRDPMPIIRGIANGVRRGIINPKAFRLRLMGELSLPIDLEEECRRLGLHDVVEFRPRAARAQALQEMVSAAALLIVQPGTTVSVPGKAYEYLAAGRPILALTDDGETADLVRASGLGVTVRPSDSEDLMADALLTLQQLGARPVTPPPLELYDGELVAARALHVLADMAGRGRRSREPVPASAIGRPEVSHPKEPSR